MSQIKDAELFGIKTTAVRRFDRAPMELLAPAGSYEAFKAAVENGADGVYLGGRSFNARASAANFGLDELRQVVQYAHERETVVYVTVNILIADQEFPELYDYLYSLYEIGVDALILQDIGVGSMIQNVLPEMERHASTQMTINTTWGVRHVERLGFQRVVLAREVSAEQMKTISAKTALEIEVFVHGALCICYSGQCLMSSYIGGRSGNRGRCAQPCRLTYQLMNEEKKDVLAEANLGNHLLSPRDLNFVEEIHALKECGVYSLKVEGRMKRPEYVATVMRIYRRALDRVLAEEDGVNTGSGVTEEEKTELLQIFNRDFSQAYFHSHPGAELMSYARPNNRGIRLGRIVQNRGNQLEIKLEAFLRPGDGIEVWTSRGREGITVRKVWQGEREIEEGKPGDVVQIGFAGKSHPGDRVFKTHDELLMEKARQSFREGKERRKRPLKMRLSGSIGERMVLEAWDRDRHVRVDSDTPAQRAVKRPLTQEYAFQQLSRLGTTPFWLAELDLELEEGLMLPVSELNDMRRLAVEGLLHKPFGQERVTRAEYKQRLKAWQNRLKLEQEQQIQQAQQYKELRSGSRGKAASLAARRLTVAVSDLEGVKAALKAGAKRIALGGERWRSRQGMSWEDIRAGVRLCKEQGAESLLRLPRILNEEQSTWWYEALLKVKAWEERPRIMVANLGELEMVKAIDPDWPFEVDYPVNIFNGAAVAHLLRLGAQGVTLSTELEHSQIETLARWPKTEVFVFGDLEMMVSEYCPVGATLGGKKRTKCTAPCVKEPHYLRDRLNYDFPIETDWDCRMHLYNVKRLNLYKELGSIAQIGVQRIRLQLDRANPVQIRDTVRVFLEGWERGLAGERISEEQAEKVNAYLVERFPEGFTKGHYFRGVL